MAEEGLLPIAARLPGCRREWCGRCGSGGLHQMRKSIVVAVDPTFDPPNDVQGQESCQLCAEACGTDIHTNGERDRQRGRGR